MIKCTRFIVLSLTFLLSQATISYAQPASSIDLTGQKPARYSERRLLSEQSGETGYSGVRGFFQNMFTHYNYYFNANNKVNEIIDRAKELNKDDYTQLLTFYNYSLDNTSKEKVQIDSIMYKVTAAVLLHDLRSNWVDNMYMLMGKAFLLKKDFDSAALVFQYINYAWGPKDVGYDLPIGSNISNDKGIFTISSEEKKHLIGRAFTPPLSRNESFLWRVRTFLEQGKTSQADGLLAILRVDPNFPKRLKAPLHEMIAYSYYKQQLYDSSAWHLQRALNQADGSFEHARWEYLIGQMLAYGKNSDSLAASFFAKSIKHTTDPLMEVFARLNIVNLNSNKKGYSIKDNINELYRLGRKDRFENYRDVIYYVAAVLEKQDKNNKGAVKALNKSLKNSNTDNPFQLQKSFLLLADTYFDMKEFRLSYYNYDSIKSLEGFTEVEKARIEDRKGALKIIASNISTVEEQDSLQRVASMEDKPRKALIKKLLKQLLKEKGIKESAALDFGDENALPNANSSTTLFSNNSGAFYFNIPELVQSGQKEFKLRWGNRANIDNWQRQDAVTKPQQSPDANPGDMNMAIGSDIDLPPVTKKEVEEPKKEKDLTYEGMMADLPLRPEQKIKSDSSIAKALFINGLTFQNNLRDYPMAIYNYEELLRRFSKHPNIEQAAYNLSYCYWKLEKNDKSDSIAVALKKNFPDGQYTAKLAKGFERDLTPDDTITTYQHVYNMFLSGDFENAQIEKAAADKKYGQTNWTPQLMFIEAVYYISRRIDHRAISKLEELVRMYPSSSLVARSNRMIDVLLKRQLIEDHLTYYTETLHTDTEDTLLIKKPKNLKEALQDIVNGIKSDSLEKPKVQTDFIYDPTERHFAVMQLENVDKVFINEVGNSFNLFNRQNYSSDQIESASEKVDDQYTLVYFGAFPDADAAVAYSDKVKPYVAKTIVPWLPSNKYKFNIISISNLQLLIKNKQVAKYNEFINRIFPSKF